MRARPLRPQIQTPSKVWVAGPVQPLEQFPRPRVFILRNLPVPLECGPPPRYIRVSAGWKRLIFWPFRPDGQPPNKEAKVSIRYLDRRRLLAESRSEERRVGDEWGRRG